jgi:hypothetical protein
VARGLITTLAVLCLAPPAAARLAGQVDLREAARPVPGPGEAMRVLRVHASGMAGDNRILFERYDPAAGRLVRGPDGKPQGARLNYGRTLFAGGKGEKALRVAIVPAGDYVLAGRTFNISYTDVFCFGAPRFSLASGQIVYVGDFEMS